MGAGFQHGLSYLKDSAPQCVKSERYGQGCLGVNVNKGCVIGPREFADNTSAANIIGHGSNLECPAP